MGSRKVFAIPRDVQPSAKKRHRCSSSDEEDFSLGDRLDAIDYKNLGSQSPLDGSTGVVNTVV